MSNSSPASVSDLLLVVSAPSGTGKTSVLRSILAFFPRLRFSVSCTTRQPRPGEVDGRDYHFLEREEFQRRIDSGEFIEWTENFGQLYGTSRVMLDAFFRDGYDVVLDIETRGARMIRGCYPTAVFIFLLPPSREELRRRLEGRGSDDARIMKERLAKAEEEMNEIFWYDYVVLNDSLDRAVDRFRSIYLAENCRMVRALRHIESFDIKGGLYYGKNHG